MLKIKFLTCFELKKDFLFPNDCRKLFYKKDQYQENKENHLVKHSPSKKCLFFYGWKSVQLFSWLGKVGPEEALLLVPPLQPDPTSPCSRAQVTSHLVDPKSTIVVCSALQCYIRLRWPFSCPCIECKSQL